MSEATRIVLPQNFEDIALVVEVCRDLRNRGLLQCSFPNEGGSSIAKNYYGQKNPHNRTKEERASLERCGEPLAVILNTSYLDVAGIAAKDGAFIGGVHIEGGHTDVEDLMQEKLRVIRCEYNRRRVYEKLQQVAEMYGSVVEEEEVEANVMHQFRIRIGGSSF